MPESNNPTQPNNDPQPAPAQQGTDTQPGDKPPVTPANFEEWLKLQSDDIKDLVEPQIINLKTALSSERTEHKKLLGRLAELSKQLEEGSEAKKSLGEITGQLEATQLRADFYEQASIVGITGTSIKLAWAAVGADELIEEFLNHRTNKVDWNGLFERMKSDYPNLFQAQAQPRVPQAHAGAGVNSQAPAPVDMNKLIVRAARRTSL